MRADDTDQTITEALLDPTAYPHPAADMRLIETHISWVLLAGEFAYKLKKPVDLGFLDFSTLARRKHFCEEELRLNRRLAPDLYLDVVTLRRTRSGLRFGDTGEIVEYAVRMRRFPQAAQLDRQLAAGGIGDEDMDGIAEFIGDFHRRADLAPAAAAWGSPRQVAAPAFENFTRMETTWPDPAPGSAPDTTLASTIAELHRWTEQTASRLAVRFAIRRATGRVRECHGDLHLRNMARIDGDFLAFDGIEFAPALRWIDVISDAAFLFMDLESRDRPRLAWRFLNRWLAATGDYAGLDLLPWYVVYRHMVRAKVDAIRLGQGALGDDEDRYLRRRIQRHLQLARANAQTGSPALIMTWGLSGSGKSWLAAPLGCSLPAVVLRSDVERKRLLGHGGRDAPLDRGIYSSVASDQTYGRLRDLARRILRSGFTVIVDASFLDPDRRTPFADLAIEMGVPQLFLRCEAEPEVLHQRVIARAREGRDPSDAGPGVLTAQMSRYGDLAPEADSLIVRTDRDIDLDSLRDRVRERLGPAGG